MSLDTNEKSQVVGQVENNHNDNRELAPALRVYEKNLLLRIEQLEQHLHANTLALRALETRLLQELQALQQAQALHTETLGKVDKIVRRGLWWRRIRAFFGWLILLALVAGALYLYFIFDWRSLLSSFL
ncbi:MAG: hypothetical protein U0350_29825 [Caldilineaceae bacterium]